MLQSVKSYLSSFTEFGLYGEPNMQKNKMPLSISYMGQLNGQYT